MNAPQYDDPRDEGRLADLTAAGMWTTAGVVGGGMFLLPGSPHEHLGAGLAIAGCAVLWAMISLVLWAKRWTMSIGSRAIATAAAAPIVAVAIWASGGATSFLQPLLLFTSLYIAYFFPPRLIWPLVAVFILTYTTPLFYDADALAENYPARALAFAIALSGASIVVQVLKRRLLRAEARQRVMAERDGLTGLYNRRSFDAALEHAFERQDGAALVLFDFDAFKAINDDHGHPVGDAVLQAVARACEEIVRQGDCLARIGGDEFAVVVPRAESAAVRRIVASLGEAIATADLPAEVASVEASFAWAIAPADAATGAELHACADQRLLDRKRLRQARALIR